MVAFFCIITNIMPSFSYLYPNVCFSEQLYEEGFEVLYTEPHTPFSLSKYQIFLNLVFPKAQVFWLFTQSLEIISSPLLTSNNVSVNLKLTCKVLLWLMKSHLQKLEL